MDQPLETFIGGLRFDEYRRGVNFGDESLVHRYYKLDLELRGLLIKSVGLVEHNLTSYVYPEHKPGQPLTFGDLRKIYTSKSAKERFEISRKFGMNNQKELDSLLASLNAFRNRAAHHERVWNYRVQLAVPKTALTSQIGGLGFVTSPFSLAANLVGIQTVLRKGPMMLHLESEINAVLNQSGLDRGFVLKSMGFEVP